MATPSDIIKRGTRAAQPTPSANAAGVLYYVTDEKLMERWSGSAWESVEGFSGGDGTISALTNKANPTDEDYLLIEDAAASDAQKHITIANLFEGGNPDFFRLEEQGSAPATPASGYGNIFAQTDGLLYWLNDAGSQIALSGVGVRAYNNANITVAHNTQTVATLNSERRDDAGFHDTVTNNSRFTVPTGLDGWYVIACAVDWETNTTGVRRTGILLNGSTFICIQSNNASSGTNTRTTAAQVYYLTAGQYVEMYLYQNTGSDLTCLTTANYSPEFSMFRLG